MHLPLQAQKQVQFIILGKNSNITFKRDAPYRGGFEGLLFFRHW